VNGPRILIIDGYPKRVREKLVEDGATVAAQLYQNTLQTCRSGVVCETVYAADQDSPLPAGTALGDFDGAVWTGSVVSVTETQNASVQQQIEFTKTVFEAGVPGFGSCFAIQIASVASGGKVSRNPKGREFGVGRELALTEAGLRHSVFDGRAPVFEARSRPSKKRHGTDSSGNIPCRSHHFYRRAVSPRISRSTRCDSLAST